jgi:hypothetical protein
VEGEKQRDGRIARERELSRIVTTAVLYDERYVMNARVSLSQAAYVASWLSGVVTTVGQTDRITHPALHAHFMGTEERPCDLDGIVNLPAFRVRVWAKNHSTFSIR